MEMLEKDIIISSSRLNEYNRAIASMSRFPQAPW